MDYGHEGYCKMSLSKAGKSGAFFCAIFWHSSQSSHERVQATKGGLYASSLMSWMMSHGEDFFGLPVNCQDVALVSTPPQLEDFVRKVSSGQVIVPGTSWDTTGKNLWVCLKMGYTPNYSHLVGIMIINHWVLGFSLFSDTPT